MKAIIIYASIHHGNTKLLVDAIAGKYDVTVFDATVKREVDLSGYDLIGVASGIYYGNMHNAIIQALTVNLPAGKDVFAIYTCGTDQKRYLNKIKELVKERKSNFIGSYSCKGFDTFGPFKLIGGLCKGHPDDNEIASAVDYFGSLAG